jgi:nucleotide-binding universal stress UspA family protein
VENVMKILIGVDDSPHAQAAIDFVKSMRWPDGARVLVLAAARPLVGAYLDAYVPAADDALQIEEEQFRFFEERARRGQRELEGAGLEVTARAERGDPREVLIEAARRERADLIVVGSHGRTGIAKLLIGSVASHVVAHAPCSVLVVKRDRAASPSPGRQNLNARQPGATSGEEPHSWG